MKFINSLLDTIKYILMGVFFGEGIVNVFNWITKPETLEALSSPWYMVLLTTAGCVALVYLAFELIKWVLNLIFGR